LEKKSAEFYQIDLFPPLTEEKIVPKTLETNLQTELIPTVNTPSELVTNDANTAENGSPLYSENSYLSPARSHLRWLPVLAIAGLLLLAIIGVSSWYFFGNKHIEEKKEEGKAAVKEPSKAPDGMAYVPGGEFKMGNDNGDEYEKPALNTTV